MNKPLNRLILLLLLAASLAACQPATHIPAPATNNSNSTGPYWPTQGWRTSTPEQQGMDSSLLAQAVEKVTQDSISLFSLLVIRNGYIVSETYFQGATAGQRREIYSCTKSFTSTLVGIATDQELIKGLKPTVLSFFPNREFKNLDADKQAMTLENVLTMNTGLAWEEGDPSYQKLYSSQDWAGFMLDLPMAAKPGTRFNYCSGCSHLLSAIVQQKTGNTAAFARKYLFEPLGITSYQWNTDSQGIPIGGWGLELTPREMAKLGYLFLHDGTWDGTQVVSNSWVQAATAKHTDSDGNLGYGYQWWTYTKYGAYAALGRYGQTVFVVPNLNLVIVTTARSEPNHDRIFGLIDNYIVPAVKE